MGDTAAATADELVIEFAITEEESTVNKSFFPNVYWGKHTSGIGVDHNQ